MYLQMGIARHDMLDLRLRATDHDADEVFQESLELLHLLEEPNSHISRDLVIARATGMKLACERVQMVSGER